MSRPGAAVPVAEVSEPKAQMKVDLAETPVQAGATRVVEDRLAAALGGVEGPVAVSVEDAGETATFK